MTFEDIARLALAGRVEALHVESSARDLFHYRAFIEGRDWMLRDSRGQPVRDRSLGHARQRLRGAGGFEGVPLFLVQRRVADSLRESESASASGALPFPYKTPLRLTSGGVSFDASTTAAPALTGRDSLACSPR
ncbi:hypothetical protein [Salinicola avicenniae]|uniref:hypothetical protein n=1 Tax=Salinicola avicenniae TaxID=2916836 RepID=UPI0020749AD7|nr:MULTISPECIES: hypothetical protein [unclassified Salinicola]